MSAPTATRWSVAAVLAANTLPNLTAALYACPDYRVGDRWSRPLEVVETFAAIEIDGLTTEDVNAILAAASDPVRLADCRAAARTILAAQ